MAFSPDSKPATFCTCFKPTDFRMGLSFSGRSGLFQQRFEVRVSEGEHFLRSVEICLKRSCRRLQWDLRAFQLI